MTVHVQVPTLSYIFNDYMTAHVQVPTLSYIFYDIH